MTVAVLCAAGVGSVGGGLTALHVSPSSNAEPVELSTTGAGAPQPGPGPASRAAAPSAPISAGGPTVAPLPPQTVPSVASQPHAPDPHAVLVIQMRAVLARVAEWSRSHAGAPCPDAATLGIAALDPWGHPIELTCTDQPADQTMGAISAGPDGIPGNTDDVKSWNLGPGATDLVQGPRWPSKPVAGKPGKRRKTSSSTNRILAMPRTAFGKPSSVLSAEPAAAPPPVSPAAVNSAATPSNAAPPIDGGDDIPTRR